MRRQELLALILKQLAEKIEFLPARDLERIADGKARLDLRVIRVRGRHKARSRVREEAELGALLTRLQLCKTREVCAGFLEEEFSNKASLAQFARFLDVPVLKRDKIDDLRVKIIEATVGATIRSKAIQGRED